MISRSHSKRALAICGFSLAIVGGPGPLLAAEASNWTVRLRTDPVTDRREGGAFLIGDDGQSRLNFSCNGLDEKTLSIQYIPTGYLGSSGNAVTFRIDDNPPVTSATWVYTYRGAYTVDGALVDLFSVLVGTRQHKIVVRALNYENQPVDAVFHSVNGREAINTIRETCAKLPIVQ